MLVSSTSCLSTVGPEAFSLADYLPILLFIFVALSIAALMLALPVAISRITGTHQPDPEKLSEYECGFPAFDSARRQFDVRFYLVAILFIIFDLEVAFLFPWAVVVFDLGWEAWGAMMIFLGILACGLAYEWKKGALDWT